MDGKEDSLADSVCTVYAQLSKAFNEDFFKQKYNIIATVVLYYPAIKTFILSCYLKHLEIIFTALG